MRTESNATTVAAIAGALIAPPAITFGLSSLLVPQRGLDIFSVLIVELLGFALAAAVVRPRPWRAVLAALLYLPTMFIVIFWIGYRAGYYDLP